MRVEQVLHVYKKELLETVRDRRTLIVMLVVPVVLYPMLALLGVQAISFMQSRIDEEKMWVAMGVPAAAAQLSHEIRLKCNEEHISIDYGPQRAEAKERIATGELKAALFIADSADLTQRLSAGQVDVEIYYDSGDAKSTEAYQRLHGILSDLQDSEIRNRLIARDLSEELAYPYRVDRQDLASPARRGAFLLGGLISFLLITMALSGSFHAAVDLTAGEKERGTLETLLVSPVRRLEVVIGKYLTVLTIAVATSILNLGCMGLTFSNLANTLQGGLDIEFELGPRVLFGMLFTLIPLAALFSATTLGTSSFARSYKEGHNYLLPIFMLVMFPALLPILPGVELTHGSAIVPVAGPALLFRALLLEEATLADVVLVFGSTAVYGALALSWATQIYRREDVLFRGGTTEIGKRKLTRPNIPVPGYRAALAMFFILFAIYGYLGLNASATEISPFSTVLLPQLVFLVGPLAVAWWCRHRWVDTFTLRTSTARSWIAVPIVAFGGFFVAQWIAHVTQGLVPAPKGLHETVVALLVAVGPAGAIALLALTPAVCEEIFCRGYLLSGFRRGLGTPTAVLTTAVLFGILHLQPARIPITAALGVVLALVVLRSGSIFCAMVIHFLNNATSVVLMPDYHKQFPDFWLARIAQPLSAWLEGLSVHVLGPLGLCSVIVGLWMMRKQSADDGDQQDDTDADEPSYRRRSPRSLAVPQS